MKKNYRRLFLRRCFFHFISFPEAATLSDIVKAHHPDVEDKLLHAALEVFLKIRGHDELKKKPSTSELLDWLRLLMIDNVAPKSVAGSASELPPMVGALLKNEQDIGLLNRLAGMFAR